MGISYVQRRKTIVQINAASRIWNVLISREKVKGDQRGRT